MGDEQIRELLENGDLEILINCATNGLIKNRKDSFYVILGNDEFRLGARDVISILNSVNDAANDLLESKPLSKTINRRFKDRKISECIGEAEIHRILYAPIIEKIVDNHGNTSIENKIITRSKLEDAKKKSRRYIDIIKDIKENCSPSPERDEAITRIFENLVMEEILYSGLLKDSEPPQTYHVIKTIMQKRLLDLDEKAAFYMKRAVPLNKLMGSIKDGLTSEDEAEFIFRNFSFSEEEKLENVRQLKYDYSVAISTKGERTGPYLSVFRALCCENGLFTPNEVIDIVRIHQLSEDGIKNDLNFILSKRFMQKLDNTALLELYAMGCNITTRNLEEKGIESKDVIDVLKNGDKNTFMRLQEKLPKKYKLSSDELFGLYSPYTYDFENSSLILSDTMKTIYPDVKNTLTSKDIMKFINQGFVEPERLVDIYELEKNVYEQLWDKDAVADTYLSHNDILAYFNRIDRILPLLNNELYRDRFKNMYSELRTSVFGLDTFKDKEYQTQLIEQFLSGKKNTPINELVQLAEAGIIDIDVLTKYIGSKELMNHLDTLNLTPDKALPYLKLDELSQEQLRELYNSPNIDPKMVLKYLNKNKITDMYFEGEISIPQIFEGLGEGNISRNTFIELMDSNYGEIREYLRTGEADPSSVLEAYMKGHISYEDLISIGIENTAGGKDKKDKNGKNIYAYGITRNDIEAYIDNLTLPTDQTEREVYLNHLEELFVNEVLSYDDVLEKLHNAGKITNDEYNRLFDVQYEIAIRKLSSVNTLINGAFPIGTPTGTITQPLHGPKKTKVPVIDPIHIENLLNVLSVGKNGTPDMKRIEIIKNALDGYTLIVLNNMKVGILEKINQDGKSNDATYVLPVIHARELSEEENKLGLRALKGDKHVIVVNHVRNYGQNLINAIAKMQEQQKISKDNPDITWAKDKNDPLREKAIADAIKEIEGSYDRNLPLR